MKRPKKGDWVLVFGFNRYGEFIVNNVFTNQDSQLCYTGTFGNGVEYTFILHSNDIIL